MVASVCCHCCKLSSCLAVSSAIASINASMSALRARDDVDVGREDESEEEESEEDEEEVGRERVAVM